MGRFVEPSSSALNLRLVARAAETTSMAIALKVERLRAGRLLRLA
jgi:hypothetical protein